MSASKIYHVKHILVKHQYEAEDVLKKISEGIEFENLAQKYSICPSAPKGGDLGPLREGQADEDFEMAAKKLAPGDVSAKPVRSKFGYHLIKRMA